MTPATIRALIAASDGSDQGEILNQAFAVLLPRPAQRWQGEGYAAVTPEWKLWSDAASLFEELFSVGADTDAALVIAEAVLPGWRAVSGPDDCLIQKPIDEQRGGRRHGIALGTGPTRALAILDAVCAAVERKDETNG